MSGITEEDYFEPRCPFCTPNSVQRIPVRRILSKLDEYFNKKEYERAFEHLIYWISEADSTGDEEGKLTLYNERVGLARKVGEQDLALSFAKDAIALAEKIGEKISLATTYLNCATAYKAFDQAEKAILFFEKAEKIYTEQLSETDEKLGGLYNNFALALCDVKDYIKAETYYNKALLVNETNGRYAESAITCCNLADLIYLRDGYNVGKERINALLIKGYSFFEKSEKTAETAYAMEKCAPVFRYYGFKDEAEKIATRSKELYEGA